MLKINYLQVLQLIGARSQANTEFNYFDLIKLVMVKRNTCMYTPNPLSINIDQHRSVALLCITTLR